MRHILAGTAVLAAAAAASLAQAGADMRMGHWVCTIGTATPLGNLETTEKGYVFHDQASGKSSAGAITWSAEAFGLQGGTLPRFGVHSGLVYLNPEQPDQPLIDLYSDVGAIATCQPKP